MAAMGAEMVKVEWRPGPPPHSPRGGNFNDMHNNKLDEWGLVSVVSIPAQDMLACCFKRSTPDLP
jgi:hypothetical protein